MPLIRKPPGAPPTAATAPAPAALLDTLVHGSDDERWSAARAAADLPDAVPTLRDALARETDPRVREALLTSLARISTPQSVDAVLPLLRSDDAQIRTGAMDALTAMKAVAWPSIETLLRDSSADVRVLACELVRSMPSETAVKLYCELLDSDPEPNVCAAAVEALAEIGAPQALPALTRCEQRFRATPFLAFAIKIAADRIRSQPSQPRA